MVVRVGNCQRRRETRPKSGAKPEGAGIHTVELHRKVRLACRDEMSERAATRHFGISRESVREILRLSVSPGIGARCKSLLESQVSRRVSH